MIDLPGLPQKQFARDAKCPLDGVRVLDLSRVVAGNMVSLLLADFGAEVVMAFVAPGKADTGEVGGELAVEGEVFHQPVFGKVRFIFAGTPFVGDSAPAVVAMDHDACFERSIVVRAGEVFDEDGADGELPGEIGRAHV